MEAKSLGDLLRRSVARHGTRTAMLVPSKDGFTPITYVELYERVRRYAGAIGGLGLQRGDRLVILSENAVEWAFTDWACQTLGIIVVPIYPTLPADQAAYIIRDSGATVVIAGDAKQAQKTADLEGVRTLILKDGEGSLDALAAGSDLDRETWERGIDGIGPDDVATIIYTSGTTGNPKGVLIPHRGFIWAGKAVAEFIELDERDTFLSFLPMSHVYERVDGQGLPIAVGASIAYAKSLASLANDIAKARPTIMLCVPRFLEATRERILDATTKYPPLRKKLFDLGLSQGIKKFNGGFAPLYFLTDKLVGAKIRERFGGRMRYFVAGGAALPKHVAEFYGAFGLIVLQGYGLTETTSGVCVNHPDRNKPHTAGEVLPGMECQIAEDGEILFRGPANAQGYYNLPEETAAAWDAEGWFHTGDIGEFEGKNLKITDRKKDLLVLGNGKNIAPQPIENKLRASPYIAEAVLLGDGMDSCVALIVPSADAVRNALSLPDGAKLSESAEAKALIKKEIDAINKTLAPFEMVKRHALLDEPFTVESGELTPTLKVKRKVVKERYAGVIAGLGG